MDSDLVKRIKKIKGQIEGVEKMIITDNQCTDIIVQLQAIRGSISSLGVELIKKDAQNCLEEDPVNQVKRLQLLIKDLFKLS